MKKWTKKAFLFTVIMTAVLAMSACGNKNIGTTSGQVEVMESTERTENMEKMGNTENVKDMENTENVKNMEDTKNMESPENVESPEPTELSAPGTIPGSEKEDGTEEINETEGTPGTGKSAPEIEEAVVGNTESTDETVMEEKSETEKTVTYTYTDVSKTMYAKRSVNVRTSPSTSGARLGSLKKNNEVTVTGRCNETGWYRIVYGDGEAFVSDKYLCDEKVTETVNAAQTDFLTPDGFLNPNNPIVAAAYEKYGENIAICEDGTVLDGATWQVLGRIDNMPGSNADEPGSFDRAAAEEVWAHMNEERVSAGLNALAWDENIYNFACQRAQQIVTDFSHNGCGNYGENIQFQSGTTPNGLSIHMLWFLSPGHHANYLSPVYGSGACAVYVYNGMTYAVQNFTCASNSQPAGGGNGEPANAGISNTETSGTESEIVGEIENGTTWTASNGVALFIRSDGLVAVLGGGDHTPEECKAALDEYNATH